MKRLTRFNALRYRLLAIVALVVCLAALMTPTASQQSTTCCNQCLNRFNQCDGTTIVCCKIYNACIANCSGGCPQCPDAE